MANRDPASEVAAAYDRWARSYETVENPTRDLAARVLRRQGPDLHGRAVLEIGCGTGLNTRYLAAGSRNVLAVDFSAGMLEQARNRIEAPDLRFERWDLRQRWRLADTAVDLIVCTLVLEHVEELAPVFREAARVLRPGGELFLAELHPYRQLRGGQAHFTDPASGETVLVPAHFHDVSDYLDAALEHGFELLRLGEWRDGGVSDRAQLPRLLSLHLRKPPRPSSATTRLHGKMTG